MFSIYAIAAFVYLFPAPVEAGGLTTYKDENGTLHAVASPEDIPEKFRGGAKALVGSGESGSGEANIKIKKVRNSLLIEVGFGGAGKHLMVLDTGATSTMISKKVADALKLSPIGYQTGHTASSAITVAIVVVPEISVAQFTVRNMKVSVYDMPGQGDVEGLLGVDFLNHFKMELDTETGQLHLKRKSK